MKCRLLITSLLIYSILNGQVQESVFENASAVIESYHSILMIHDPGSASQTVKKKVLVFNQAGLNKFVPYVYYDEFINIADIRCVVSNSNGEELEKFREKDFVDQSITSGGTLYDHSRIKYLDLNISSFPVTIEFEYEIKYTSLFNYPSWSPRPFYEVGVVESTFEVIVPPSVGLRFRWNLPGDIPEIQENEDLEHYKWQYSNLLPIRKEPFSLPDDQIIPCLHLAPTHFIYDGNQGDLSTWQSFGKWLYSLLEDRSELSEEESNAIKDLVKNIESPREKVEILYKYLQENTRYVSVQLGIGGYQPIDASKVAEVGYGDCKALSNYMRVMLAYVGIPSNYTVIGAGKSYSSLTFADLPNAFQANHVILSVPLENDTIWLECTSQTNPFGYLGSFTDDRNALCINDQGGFLVRTPKYEFEDSKVMSRIDMVLDEDQTLQGTIHAHYTNVYREKVIHQLANSKKDQIDFIQKRLDISGLDVVDVMYTKHETSVAIDEKIQLAADNYATVSGDRMFLQPVIHNRWQLVPPSTRDRKQKISIREAVHELDTMAIKLPQNVIVEAIPEIVHEESPFGSYLLEITHDDVFLNIVRRFTLHDKTYEASDYKSFRSFLRKVSRGDKSKVVLKLKQ